MKTIGGVRGFARDDRGSVSIMAAAFGVALVASLAVAVDVSNLYLQRRHQQGALDLAAVAAARDLNVAEAAARTALAANGLADPGVLTVTLGHYEPDSGRDASGRFVAATKPFNAVQLVMTKPGPLYFGSAILGGAKPPVRTRSIAVNTRIAAFLIGSQLASLNRSA